MSWSDKFIGIPFLEVGRDFNGCDCGGLILLVLREEKKIIAKDFVDYEVEDFQSHRGFVKIGRGIDKLVTEDWTVISAGEGGSFLGEEETFENRKVRPRSFPLPQTPTPGTGPSCSKLFGFTCFDETQGTLQVSNKAESIPRNGVQGKGPKISIKARNQIAQKSKQMPYWGVQGESLPLEKKLSQKKEKKKEIDYSKLKPFDVLRFRTGKAHCHVGIYVGQDLFLHVEENKGKFSHLTELNDLEWGPRLFEICRHKKLVGEG